MSFKYYTQRHHKTGFMGILNLTPDSFSDGGKFNTEDKALLHALQMADEGADFIDIGAQSTRPGHSVISEQEELSRLFPTFNIMREKISIPISVDTFYTHVAEKVLKSKANIINDVSGNEDDEMLRVVKAYNADIVIMYSGKGLDGIVKFFEKKLNQAVKLGVKRENICFDPGIGFGKSQQENINAVRNIKKFKTEGIPVLIGLSKKSLLPFCLKDEGCDISSATIGANIAAVLNGADILRVHDVKENKDALKAVLALLRVF